MNRAQRRAHDRNQDRTHRAGRRTGRTLLALGSASVVASAGAGAAVVLAGPAGALPPPNPTLVVNSLADTSDGTCDVTDCTLREAIAAANSVSGHDEITFSVTGTITLTAALPLITEAVDVHGPGATSLAISGNDTVRAFTVKDVDFGSLEFTDLTIEHCRGGDGPAFNLYGSNSTFLIEDVVLQHNFTTYDGGAINFYATGDLTINRSSVLYNSAGGGGGALYANADGSGPATGMTVTITDSQFRHNTADDNGGALYLTDLTATITNSTFDTNSAADVAGSGYYGDGGAIFARATSLTVANSTISGNSADSRGGAIWAEYDYATAPTLAQLEIDNSTISGNDAGTAGALKTTGRIRTTINQSTITGNSAYYGGSPAVQVDGAYSDRWYNSISGSILVGNTASGSPSDLGPANTAPRLDVAASLIGWFSNYFDVFDPDAATVTGVTLASLNLGALADNGGPTKTISLGTGSVAIDAGPDPVASFPGNTFDQRGTGYPRVNGSTVDVGAFEATASAPPPTALVVTGPAPGSRSVGLSWTAPTGPTPDGYQIRCMPQGYPFDIGPGGKVVYVGSTTTSVTVPGLTGGETYVCYVRARYGPQYFSWLGDAYEGPPSDPSAPFTVARTAPPVPERIQASTPPQPSGQTTLVGFVEPENLSGAPISRYDARCTSTNGGTTRTGTGATSPVGVGNLTKGRTYTCVVSAVNSVGPSAWSTASNRIVVPAGPVSNVRASTPANRKTTVTFTPPDGGPTPVRYWVECRTADGSSTLTAGAARSPVTVTNLVRGRTYTCRVWAIFDGGAAGPVSSPSNPVTVP